MSFECSRIFVEAGLMQVLQPAGTPDRLIQLFFRGSPVLHPGLAKHVDRLAQGHYASDQYDPYE
jgi:hypothetical protein